MKTVILGLGVCALIGLTGSTLASTATADGLVYRGVPPAYVIADDGTTASGQDQSSTNNSQSQNTENGCRGPSPKGCPRVFHTPPTQHF